MKNFGASLILVLVIVSNLFAQGIPKSAYVLNTLGQNLSVINLQNGSVNQDALLLGLFPNEIKIRGERAYAINSGVNEVQVIRLNPLATVHHIDVGNGTNPWSIEFVNDSIAVVSLFATDSVAIVNVSSAQVIQKVSVGISPEGLKYDNGKIYVANSGFNGAGFDPGTVSVIDAATFNVIDTYNVGINPQDLDVDSQGRLVVVCTGDYGAINGQVDIVDLSTGNVVSTIPFTSWVTSLGINAQDQCYIGTSGSGVMVYNLITQVFERSEADPLPGGPGIDFDSQNNVYITDFVDDSVRVFSTSHQEVAAYPVGDGPISIAIYDSGVTSLDLSDLSAPQSFALYQNYPNPFNPATVISWQLAVGNHVKLAIYNSLGQRIRTLVDERQPAGVHQAEWDGRDENGSLVSSGIYFYQIQVGDGRMVRKMQLIR